jgi:hypothetical protein
MGGVAAMVGSSFADRLITTLERVETRRADTPEEREAIYRLRYDAYVREGMVNASATPRLTDEFDELPNAFLFGIRIDGELVSSIRINVASPLFPAAPAIRWFRDELAPEVAAGRVIVDPNRFAVSAEATRALPELPYVTVRLSLVATQHFQADLAVATVRGEHQAFYQRVFGLQPLVAPTLRETIEKPIGLMTIRDFSARERIMRRYPCFASTPEERRALFDRGPGDAASLVRGRNGTQRPAAEELHLHVA